MDVHSLAEKGPMISPKSPSALLLADLLLFGQQPANQLNMPKNKVTKNTAECVKI